MYDRKNIKNTTTSNNIELQTTIEIRKLGIPANLKGYYYLRTAVMIAIKNREFVHCVTTELYPKIAEMYKTSPMNVDRTIRHAIDIACERDMTNTINSYFGCETYNKQNKPTNSEVIAIIVDNICLKNRK